MAEVQQPGFATGGMRTSLCLVLKPMGGGQQLQVGEEEWEARDLLVPTLGLARCSQVGVLRERPIGKMGRLGWQ